MLYVFGAPPTGPLVLVHVLCCIVTVPFVANQVNRVRVSCFLRVLFLVSCHSSRIMLPLSGCV